MHNPELLPIARALPPLAFNILDEARRFVTVSGEMDIPVDHTGYVIYGPYWPMSSGRYIVEPEIIPGGDADCSYGDLEICDNGVILAKSCLRVGIALSASLPAIAGLEIRVKAARLPFRLIRVVVVHVPDSASRLDASEVRCQRENLAAVDSRLASSIGVGLTGELLTLSPRRRYEALAEAVQVSAPISLVESLSKDLAFDAGFDAWLAERDKPTVYDVWGSNLELNADVILGMGFDLASVRLTGSDGYGQAAFYAQHQGREDIAKIFREMAVKEAPMIASPWLRQLSDVIGTFGRLTAALGCACVTCPFTGEVLTSVHSLVIPHSKSKQTYIFYRFNSVTDFYIISAGFPASKAFLYVPSRNVILRLHAPNFEWGTPQGAVDRFLELSIRHASTVVEYESKPTSLSVLCGTIDNLGHFFWNEVSGLLDSENEGLLASSFTPVLAQYGFLNPFDLLVNNRTKEPLYFNDDISLFLGSLQSSLFCVRLTSSQVSDRIAATIHRNAIGQSDMASSEALREALKSKYLLWVGLRTHNKVWIEQIEGIIYIASHLVAEYGQVALFVDGTPDCAAQFAQLREKLPESVKVYSGVDVPLPETIVWAYNVDGYVATIGSGLVIPTWLAAKPGVAHSETHHLHQMGFWGDVRRSAPPPLTPSVADIADQSVSGYCDYSISPEVILSLVKELPRPTRHGGQFMQDTDGISRIQL